MRLTDFKGATVYVVGGSMGIGLAVAKRAAGLGSRVAIFARRAEPLQAAATEIRQASNDPSQPVGFYSVDVADPLAVKATIAAAAADIGAPRVLINCAGRAYPRRFSDISWEQFDETMRVNLHGCWNTVQAALPYLREHGGYIVNTSSLAGLIGVYGYSDYCASKFAIVGFSEALRQELHPNGITVSVLCPPDTDTPGFSTENQTKPEETKAISAGARVLSSDAVAAQLFRGMAKETFLIIPGWEGRLGALAKRLLPGAVEWSFRRTIRRTQKAQRGS